MATAPVSVIDIVDSINPNFFGFGDPVINNAHTVAAFAGVPTGFGAGVEVFSGNARGITARSDPTMLPMLKWSILRSTSWSHCVFILGARRHSGHFR